MGQGRSVSRDKIDDVKRQIGGDDNEQPPIYQLLNVKDGGGKLIEIIKESINSVASLSGDSMANGRSNLKAGKEQVEDEINRQICELVKPLLYNDGRGKMVPLSRLSLARFGCTDEDYYHDCLNNDTDEDATIPDNESNLNSITNTDDEENRQANSHKRTYNEEQRFVCWKLEERGFVGETALHICFLLSTTTHMQLARRLLRLFPNLINDIYTSDVYFGESSLHMSIVNEDVKILKTLLDYGANVNERCLGKFFLCEDQKNKVNVQQHKFADQLKRKNKKKSNKKLRGQLMELDWSSNQFQTPETNYVGYCYWGEYPLSFAVSLNLEHCFRLLLASGANPNLQDSNGNTSLHMAVFANKLDMFDLCYSSGADIRVKNKQKLTPLTLAAKLERVEMFFHILEIQRQVNWIFCNVAFVDIRLDEIDSICTVDGSSIEESALAIVVFGGSNAHLKMLDGFLGQLLTVKWETTQKGKFFSLLCHFTIVFAVFAISYVTRVEKARQKHQQVAAAPSVNVTGEHEDDRSLTANSTSSTSNLRNSAPFFSHSQIAYVNTSSEILLIVLIILYLHNAFFRTLRGSVLSVESLLKTVAQSPEMSLFFITALLILACIPLRMLELETIEDALFAVITFALPLKFLFFCRAFRSVGPFVLMIYKIVVNDVLCFVVILLIFVFGFAQSFSIIFKTHRQLATNIIPDNLSVDDKNALMRDLQANAINNNNELSSNYFENPLDGILSMHLMALNEFGMVFDQFDSTDFPNIAKAIFLIYMILGSILLFNMLIAMLGKTYQDIASQPNENLRQWARTLLMVEKSWKDSDKLKSLHRYSQERTIQTFRADPSGNIQVVDIKSRYYCTTWTLNPEDKKRVDFIRKLTEENMRNAQKIRNNKPESRQHFK